MGHWFRTRWTVLTLLALAPLSMAAPSWAARYEKITLQASTTQTATGTSTAVDLLKLSQLTDSRHKGKLAAIYLNITAVSGTTPTLDLKAQCSPDNLTFYDPASTSANRDSFVFAQKTTTGQDMKIIPDLPCRYLRLNWTIGGTTPSFTFAVISEFLTGDLRQMDP